MLAKSCLKNCLRQAETASKRSRRLRFETTASVTSRRIWARSAAPRLRLSPLAAGATSVSVGGVSSGMPEGGRLKLYRERGQENAGEVRETTSRAGRIGAREYISVPLK